MGDAIWFGNIVITDVNQNDLYDPKVDLVTDNQGKKLLPKVQTHETQKALKYLKAKSWQGISLFDAGKYLDSFREATRYAHLGEVDEVRLHLQDATKYSGALPLQYDQARANDTLKKAFQTAIPEKIKTVQKILKSGVSIGEALENLKKVEEYSSLLRALIHSKNLPYGKLINVLFKKAYQLVIPELKKSAGNSAANGHVDYTESIIQELIQNANEALRRFNMKFKLAQKDIDQWMITAYQNGIPATYQRLQRLATRGQTMRVRAMIGKLKSHLNQAGNRYGLTFLQLPANWESLIMEDALINGIEDNFKIALRKARRGSIRGADKWVRMAERYVIEYNRKYAGPRKLLFDTNRADTIRDCSRGAIPCPSAGSFPRTQRP